MIIARYCAKLEKTFDKTEKEFKYMADLLALLS